MHPMDYVWIGLFLAVVTAQIAGMRSGRPLSRVVQRLTEHSRTASMFIGALVMWLPAHWMLERATTVGTGDYIAIGAGLIIGWLVHEKRKRARIRARD